MLDLVLTALAFALPIGYHLKLRQDLRHRPCQTSIGLAARARRSWVSMVMEERRDVLVVQTLRNWEMASTFLASTAILISLALLGILFSSDRLHEVVEQISALDTSASASLTLRMGILAADFALAFLNFSISLRYFNNVGFMACVPSSRDPAMTPELVARILNRAARHFTLGMRSYYMSVPLSLWFLGTLWLLAGSVLMVAMLYTLDYLREPTAADPP